MAKEIIVNVENEQTRIAILENGELVELYIENVGNERTIGDICLGRVRKIMPSILAAFVDIGQKQDAFLHFSDLSDNLPELVEFLKDPKPEVGKQFVHPEPHLPRGKRRHPTSHRDSAPHNGAPGATEHAAEEPAEAPDAALVVADADIQEKSHRGVSDVRARGQRRSAQRKHAPRKPTRRVERPSSDDQRPSPETFLKRDQKLLVKIVKEPISSKGSRVSTDISLAGRFLVLVPLADYVAVSKKIVSYKERRRLRTLAKSLLPDGFGLIVRTVAEGKNAKALDTDLRLLIDKWRKIERKLADNPEPPCVVHEDVNLVSSVIRDLFSEDYDRILVDDQRLFRNIKSYIQAVAPHMAAAVQIHSVKKHIFETAGIAKDVARAFESRIDLPSGGYLFLEKTEAMHVIDVNSGRSGRGMTQEDNSLKVNLEAARLIARQIRLRDLGGIIVVDFIDLRHDHNRQKVYDELKREFRKDRAVTKLLPMSDFGLIQITRQRLRPSITTMANANGTPKLPENPPPRERNPGKPPEALPREKQPAAEDFVRRIEEWIVTSKAKDSRRAITLQVHPFTAAYLNRKVPNYPTRWFVKHLVRIRMETDDSLPPFRFRCLDPRTGAEVRLPEEETPTGKQTA